MSRSLRLVAVACLLVGCSSHKAPAAPGAAPTAPVKAPSAAAAAAAAASTTTTTTTKPVVHLYNYIVDIQGDLTAEARDRIPPEAGSVIDSWITNAFLAGNRAGAFGIFTPGAQVMAQQHADVLSFPEPLEALTYTAPMYVFARDGLPQGAGADLTFIAGSPTTEIDLLGSVELVPTPDGWRIFGFDLTVAVNGEATTTVTTK